MGSAIETLMGEHRAIERVLDALDIYATGVAQGGASHREDLSDFLAFLREFADLGHHCKEEKVLFVAMDASGFPAAGGPVGSMLHEHNIGRELVSMLRALAQSDEDWSDGERNTVVAAVQELTQLLRDHIVKEDQVLYPMAMQALSAQAMRDVDSTCAELEQKRTDNGDTARLHTLAATLTGKYR